MKVWYFNCDCHEGVYSSKDKAIQACRNYLSHFNARILSNYSTEEGNIIINFIWEVGGIDSTVISAFELDAPPKPI